MIYVSYEDIANTIRKNLWKIPEDIDLIVGIPRSGMIPALMIAEFLNKRVTDLDSFIEGRVMSCGRKGNYLRPGKEGKVLVIDDTVYSGHALEEVKERLKDLEEKYEILYSCVYAEGKSATEKVDIFLEDTREKSLIDKFMYEQNIFQHGNKRSQWLMFDMDGVLCKNPPNDKHTEQYEEYIKNAIPMIVPSNIIGAICTYRLEKYRDITEKWLKEHGITYNNLYMFDAPNRETRNLTAPWKYKGRIYRDSPWAKLFIESDPKQAEEIFNLSGKPVLCYENGKFYR